MAIINLEMIADHDRDCKNYISNISTKQSDFFLTNVLKHFLLIWKIDLSMSGNEE